jgi:D-sedoheptulose 7-phosphate isomerase
MSYGNPCLDELFRRYPVLAPVLAGPESPLIRAFDLLCQTFESGGKLLVCGNGGSASDADHLAGELLKGFCSPRKLSPEWREQVGESAYQFLQNGLPVIPLANLTGVVSAYHNDAHPHFVFAQLVWVLGQPSDTLLGLSTSGRSKNILEAARIARVKGLKTVGLSGRDGGNLKSLVDVCICVPETETYKIQELHLPIYHVLCRMLEAHFFGKG